MTKTNLDKVPMKVVFKTRVRDESVGGENPFRWQDVKSAELFKGKRVIVFSLPGAFTPTCSNMQLPTYEKMYKKFQKLGIDDIYCISVNDAFVMYQWGKQQKVKNVKLIPDGSGKFTSEMGMLVLKDNLGFGARSWRYAMIVNDGKIEAMFAEEGMKDDHKSDPYLFSTPENVYSWLMNNPSVEVKFVPSKNF